MNILSLHLVHRVSLLLLLLIVIDNWNRMVISRVKDEIEIRGESSTKNLGIVGIRIHKFLDNFSLFLLSFHFSFQRWRKRTMNKYRKKFPSLCFTVRIFHASWRKDRVYSENVDWSRISTTALPNHRDLGPVNTFQIRYTMKCTGLATGAASLDTCLLNVGKPILSLMRRYLAMKR